MKYIKKPVVIEAVQFTRRNIEECIKFTRGNVTEVTIPRNPSGTMQAKLKTLESGHGGQVVTEGDFIIKGIQGEFYPCKPDVFYETYEEFKEEL